MLPVLGSYSATAPFDCPKSKRILEEGCRALATRMAGTDYLKGPTDEPSPRSLNAPALLARRIERYRPFGKKVCVSVADFFAPGMHTLGDAECQ